MDYLGFSTYKITSSVNRGSFTPFFPNWVLFCFCFCPVPLARASETMQNRSGENRYLCLVRDLKGENIQSSMFKYNVSCAFFIGVLYQVSKVTSVLSVLLCITLIDIHMLKQHKNPGKTFTS